MAKKRRSGRNDELKNEIKTLHANIRFQSIDYQLKTIAITSSVPNEGKSTTAIELAIAMAEAGSQVLIVEADMRRRSLAGMLGVSASYGIYSVLSGNATLQQAVVPTKTPNLFFLDVEPSIPNPADILASKSFNSLIGSLRNSFDYVVFDMPPVGTFVDAAVLSPLVDATILVVRQNFVHREELIKAHEQLVKAGGNVIGACVTFCEGTGSEYYYAYYNEDGKRIKKSKKHKQDTSAPQMPANSSIDWTPLPAANPQRAATASTQQQRKVASGRMGSHASHAANSTATTRRQPDFSKQVGVDGRSQRRR